jgi:signal transduction histidine kinase
LLAYKFYVPQNDSLPPHLLESILLESPTAGLILDQKQRVLFCNYAAQGLLQRKPHSLRDVLGLLPAPQQKLLEALWEKNISGQDASRLLLSLPTEENERSRSFSLSMQKLEGCIAIWMQEVSPSVENKRFSLSALLSHELRAPLVSIRGYTELIATERLGPLNDRQKRGMNIALRNIESLVELIENLLLYSKLDSGAGIGKLTRQSLLEAIHEVLQPTQQQCAEKNISFHADLPAEPIFCRIDRPTFLMALRNLLSNAVKFTDTGGSVSLELKSTQDKIQIVVVDSGIGITKEELVKIFEPFYQVDGVITRRYRGAGLGLALSKEVLTQHGGSLEVGSNLERGSRFTISLPLPE